MGQKTAYDFPPRVSARERLPSNSKLQFLAVAATAFFFFSIFTGIIYASTPGRILSRAQAVMGNSAAIQESIRSSSSFDCLRMGRSCGGGSVTLASAVGTLVNDPLSVEGLDVFGRKCALFDEMHGNFPCVFRMDVSWQPLCLNPACTRFQIHFQVSLRHRSGFALMDRLFAAHESHGFDVPGVYESRTRTKPAKVEKGQSREG